MTPARCVIKGDLSCRLYKLKAPKGANRVEDARRPWPGVRPRQDRRPRRQGPEGPLRQHALRRLRGRPDAAPAAPPEVRLQQHPPPRARGGPGGRPRGAARGRRPGRAEAAGLVRGNRDGVVVLGERRAEERRDRSRCTGSRPARAPRSRRPAGRWSSSPRPSRCTRRPRPRSARPRRSRRGRRRGAPRRRRRKGDAMAASGAFNIFKIPELRKRLLFSLGMLAVYRLGIYVTTPGVDRFAMKERGRSRGTCSACSTSSRAARSSSSRSSRSASCRTSPPPSSSSSSPSSSRRSRS